MCGDAPENEKIQAILGFPPGWGFYFADKEKRTSLFSELISDYHPILAGLVLLFKSGDNNGGAIREEFNRMSLVARACGYSKTTLESKLNSFLHEKLGV